MAGEHAATGIHIVVGIPVVDVPLLVVVVPIDVDENGAACVLDAIYTTTHRILSGLNRMWDLEVRQHRAPTCNMFLRKTRVHTPRNHGRADSGTRRFGILMRKPWPPHCREFTHIISKRKSPGPSDKCQRARGSECSALELQVAGEHAATGTHIAAGTPVADAPLLAAVAPNGR